MKNETELYRTAVSQLEEAANQITHGNLKAASKVIYSLEEEVYEFCLDQCMQNHRNLDYYRARFVFASLEVDSEEMPAKQDIEIYKLNWISLSIKPTPKVVTVHGRRIIANQYAMPLSM